MKKLFALLSAFVLTLAIIGLATKAPVASAADEKWTVDPTLAEDEIPMYEMGSIYTTFPNYYDNAAKPDELWGGSSRMYPWNETRLRVAEYDAQGAATGKYYAIFFSGLTSHLNKDGTPASGAGNNVNGYAYKEADGTLTTVRVKTGGGYTYDATPADPSLSHLRVNFTGEDISINMIEVSNRIGDGSNAQNLYNRMFVFDGEGRIIRGVGMDSFYLKAGADGAAADVWAPQFCYVDGVVTPYAEGVECDKAKEAVLNEDGSPKLDENGEAVYVETDEPNYVYKRFMWEFFETKPENVNTAGYMLEGWDCDLWDLCLDVEGGYMAIAFLNDEGTNHKIKDEERAVTNATRAAAGQEALAEGDHFRACVAEIRIPKDGGTFDFGYLDKGVPAEAAKFNNIIRGAYMSGRNVKSAEVKTYDFSSKPLTTFDAVVDDKSYQLMVGKNYVEVLHGDIFKPAKNIIYDGLASAWLEKDNVQSYKKDLNALEYSMFVDGAMVVYKYPYADKAEMVADFENDVRAWFAPGTAAGGAEGKYQNFTVADTEAVGWDFIALSYNANCFWADAGNRAKWAWMVNYVADVRKANGLSASHWETIDQGLTGSPGTFNAEISAFLNDTIKNPGAWNRTSDYTTGEGATEQSIQNATGFLPKESNQSAFLNYEIDTTNDHIDQIHVVKFVVKNAAGIEQSITLNYVVVDEYTPIIEVDKNKLYIEPVLNGDKYEIAPINPMEIAKAYNARYNGVSIKGDDISQNIHFSSETLDFNNPTEGVHEVYAVVYNDVRHYAETKFNISITDVTAPYVEFYSSLVLPYGTTWTPELTVKKAVDNVEGNLIGSTIEWCIDESNNKVKTTTPGTYKVTVSVYDTTGNCTTVKKAINVQVLEKNASAKDIVDALAGVEASVSEIKADLGDVLAMVEADSQEIANIKAAIELLASAEDIEAVKAAIAALPEDADIAAVKAAIDSVKATTDSVEQVVTAKGCGKSAYFIEFLAAGCLLVFLLRKKH